MEKIYITNVRFKDMHVGEGEHIIYFTVNDQLDFYLVVYENRDKIIDLIKVVHQKKEDDMCPLCNKKEEACSYFTVGLTEELFEFLVNHPNLRIKALYKGLLE